MAELDARDRAFATRLVLGVTGATGMLDAVVRSHLSKGKLEPKVRDAMRIGTYELLFMGTPASAAVSQAVELARMANPRTAGLANAVLRKVVMSDVPARAEALSRVREGGSDPEDFVLVSGYPAWLLRDVADHRGAEVARGMALSALEPAPVYVAGNLALGSEEETLALLNDAALSPRTAELPGALELQRPMGLAASGLVESVRVVVSDLSAQRVASMVAPAHDAQMLEVGQGRGTKSILVQNAARRKGAAVNAVGLDAEAFKVRVAQRRMHDAGLAEAVRCVTFDARRLADSDVPDELRGPFDVVFVDAPCTGTGTLRRHPEIAWALDPHDIDALSKLQKEILEASAARVANGGALWYSTCSLMPQENEQVIECFLHSARGRKFAREGEWFQSFPTPGGPDGHFCACLRKM